MALGSHEGGPLKLGNCSRLQGGSRWFEPTSAHEGKGRWMRVDPFRPHPPRPETLGFFVCVDDLEDDLIRAVGAERVERIVEAEGQLGPFRTLQKQPPCPPVPDK
jgi:hypothetical protein